MQINKVGKYDMYIFLNTTDNRHEYCMHGIIVKNSSGIQYFILQIQGELWSGRSVVSTPARL